MFTLWNMPAGFCGHLAISGQCGKPVNPPFKNNCIQKISSHLISCITTSLSLHLLMLKTYFNETLLEAGCDEAGRGCLAGPVFAAAVILPKDFDHDVLNDSKQLTHAQREELRPLIQEKAVAWAVAKVDHTTIDEINILNASFLAMHKALNKLSMKPEFIIV